MNFGWSFIVRPCQSQTNTCVKVERELLSFFRDEAAKVRVVSPRHVGKTRTEAIFIWSDQRIRSLQVDVVTNGDQRPLGIVEIDASSGVGDDERFDAHTGEHANRKRYLFRRVAFV